MPFICRTIVYHGLKPPFYTVKSITFSSSITLIFNLAVGHTIKVMVHTDKGLDLGGKTFITCNKIYGYQQKRQFQLYRYRRESLKW